MVASSMDSDLILLNLAVFAASALQSATGIGFGVIAGPILLVALNDGSAIQISIILNLLIATLLAPSLRRQADTNLLKKLVIGLLVGAPIGFLVFVSLDLVLLKVFAGLAVLFTLLVTVRGFRNSSGNPGPVSEPGDTETLSIGAVAGVMGASLAMPGPIPAAWLSVRGFSKETIRATILLMFVFAYAIALALQIAGSGIGADTLQLCMLLAPATTVGIISGRILSSHISEQIFRRALVIILAATAMTLFTSLL